MRLDGNFLVGSAAEFVALKEAVSRFCKQYIPDTSEPGTTTELQMVMILGGGIRSPDTRVSRDTTADLQIVGNTLLVGSLRHSDAFHDVSKMTPEQLSALEELQVPDTALSIAHLQQVCADRSKRWHDKPEKQWSTLEIAGSMAGEAGEAANVAKKIKRIDCGMQNKHVKVDAKTRQGLVYKLGYELADVIIYACNVATKEGIDLATAIKTKFNQVSEDEGFPERL